MHNINSRIPELNDEEKNLIDQAASGNTQAFARLYDNYADRIYRHIYYRTGNIEDARDLTQEVFLKAWQALPKYKRTSTPFLGWLFTISHNRVIDYYRTKKVSTCLDNVILLEDQAKTPEILAEEQFNQHEVRKAILQLPQDQQQVIIMGFLEGLEYSEIAAALNKSEGNIRVIIHRAIKKLRDYLRKPGD